MSVRLQAVEEIMSATRETTASRGAVARRFLYAVVALIFFEVVTLMIQLAVVFQHGYLLVAKKRSEPLRIFCNRLARYGYRIMRYATLNENIRPFPFGEFPMDKDCEPPARQVLFR